jgi:hypothetical protein
MQKVIPHQSTLLPEEDGNKYKDYQKWSAELHSNNESFRNSKIYFKFDFPGIII